MKKITIALLSLFIGIIDTYGQSKSITKVDSLLTEMTRQDLFSGAVLIADSSKILLSKGDMAILTERTKLKIHRIQDSTYHRGQKFLLGQL